MFAQTSSQRLSFLGFFVCRQTAPELARQGRAPRAWESRRGMCLLEVVIAVCVLSVSLMIITQTAFMARQQVAFCKAHFINLAQLEEDIFTATNADAEPLALAIPGLSQEMPGQKFSISWQIGRKEYGLKLAVFMPAKGEGQ